MKNVINSHKMIAEKSKNIHRMQANEYDHISLTLKPCVGQLQIPTCVTKD